MDTLIMVLYVVTMLSGVLALGKVKHEKRIKREIKYVSSCSRA